MPAVTVAVDLAKSVFQLTVADAQWRVVESHRLTRTQFERWIHPESVTTPVTGHLGGRAITYLC